MTEFTAACSDFAALSASTESTLRSLWDEVGLGEAERTRQLQNLVAEVRGVFDRAVAEEEGIRAEYLGEVGRLREDIKAVSVSYHAYLRCAGLYPLRYPVCLALGALPLSATPRERPAVRPAARPTLRP